MNQDCPSQSFSGEHGSYAPFTMVLGWLLACVVSLPEMRQRADYAGSWSKCSQNIDFKPTYTALLTIRLKKFHLIALLAIALSIRHIYRQNERKLVGNQFTPPTIEKMLIRFRLYVRELSYIGSFNNDLAFYTTISLNETSIIESFKGA